MTAGRIMSREVTTIHVDTSAISAMKIFLREGMDALPVLNDSQELVGIISETDFIYVDRKLNPISHYAYDETYIAISSKTFFESLGKLKDLKAKDIMTRKLVMIEEDTPIEKIVDIIINKKIKTLPVVEGEKLKGIIARRNILQHYIHLNKKEVEE